MQSATLYTSAEVAQRLGCHPATVRRAAERLGIRSRAGRTIALTEAHLEAIRGEIREKSGCPNFVPGNDLWRRRKKV